MDLAKVKGFIVERRQQATMRMSLANVSTADLDGLLAQLPEPRRRRLLAEQASRPPMRVEDIPTDPE